MKSLHYRLRFFLCFLLSTIILQAHARTGSVTADTTQNVPAEGLVAWYPFNGNANDASGNGHHGIVSNANLVADRFGNPNSAYDFNGKNAFIKVLSNPSLNLTEDFSISSWFRADTISDVVGTIKMILTKHRNGIETDGYVYGIWYKDQDINITDGFVNVQASPVYSALTYPEGTTGKVSINTWYHYVATYKADPGVLSYYLNGNLIDEVPVQFNNIANTVDLLIGAEWVLAGNDQKNYFNGKLDDIAIYNRTISGSEVIQLYAGNASIVVKDIDDNVYNTVLIGTQLWMKENLQTTRYSNGDSITQATTWANLTSGAWTYYDEASYYNVPYGKLYNWYTVADQRNVCPTGWKVPDDVDWKVLTDYLGGEAIAGGKLKSMEYWGSPNTNATNESGFTAVPGGMLYFDASAYYSIGGYGYWWSATESINPEWGRSFKLWYDQGYSNMQDDDKNFGFSIRCLRDFGAITLNTPPSDILLGPSGILEKLPVGTYIGTLSAADSEGGGFVFELVDGEGGEGNASFTIDGDQLLSAQIFNYTAQSEYSIRVRVTDAGGLSYEKQLTVTISSTGGECQWFQIPNLPAASRNRAQGFSINGTGYFIGGEGVSGTLNECWSYNETAGWIRMADYPGPLANAGVGFAVNGRGYYGFGAGSNANGELYQYDPETNTWSEMAKADIDNGNYWSHAYFLINEVAYFVNSSNEVYTYNTSTNTWAQKNDFPGLARFTGIGFSVNGKGYYGTGVYNWDTPYLNDFWEYDPDSDTWEEKASLPGAGRYASFGISLNGKGYVIGGEVKNPRGTLNEFLEYDPVTNVWRRLTDLPFSNNYLSGFIIGGNLYVGLGAFGYTTSVYRYCNAPRSNTPPTNILLGSSSILEKLPVGTYVGTLSAEDEDGGEFIFALANGEGSEGNVSFTIDGNQLLTGKSFDFAKQKEYSIRVRVTDSLGLSYEKILVIQILELLDECISEDGLVAWYPFNGNANDQSKNNYHGTVNQAILTNDRFGNPNSAYRFGDNADIVVPGTSELNLYPLTISLWYAADSLREVENSNIFSKYVPAAWNGYQLLLGNFKNVPNTNGVFHNNGFGITPWYTRNISNRVIGYYGEPPFLQENIRENSWYHYVFVVDENEGRIYINGVLVDTQPWNGEPGPATSQFLWKIGGYYHTWFNGKLDDIAIYNKALTQAEVQKLYTITGQCEQEQFTTISGVITKPGNILLKRGLAKLFYENGGIYSIAQITDGLFTIDPVEPGKYILQVVPLGNESSDVLPTYYLDAAFQKDAVVLTVDSSLSISMVMLEKKSNPIAGNGKVKGKVITSGSGSRIVSGRIMAGAGIPDLPVYLLDETKDEVRYFTLTDVNGDFEFTLLPNGKYRFALDVVSVALEASTASITVDESAGVLELTAVVGEDDNITVDILVNLITGVEFNDRILALYPNPVQDFLTLQLTPEQADALETIQVYGIDGKLILERKNESREQNIVLDVSAQPRGMYMLGLQFRTATVRLRFVKQ